MSLVGEQVLLRVYLRNGDRAPFMATWERIVKAARKQGLAGATVLKGIMGAGSRGLAVPSHWAVVDHLPLIVEVVDGAERIVDFVGGALCHEMSGGMATLERANVVMYRQRSQDPTGRLSLGEMLRPLSTIPPIPPGGEMTINENGVLLRVFIGESDVFQSRPLYEAIVQKVRELGLAGATVLRGSAGFGANSVVHRAGLLEMSADLPILVEIVDTEPRIKLLLPHLESMVQEGMITMEYVMILFYRHNPKDAPPPLPKSSDGGIPVA